MDWILFSNWFKTTILGIIILGAIGSLIAYYIIKVSQWVLKKYLIEFFRNFAIRYVKYAIIHVELSRRLSHIPNSKLYFVHFITVGILAIISTIIFFSFLTITILFFTIKGPFLSIFSFALVIICFLSLSWFLKELGALAGTVMDNLEKEIKAIEEKFKDENELLKFKFDESHNQKQIEDK